MHGFHFISKDIPLVPVLENRLYGCQKGHLG